MLGRPAGATNPFLDSCLEMALHVTFLGSSQEGQAVSRCAQHQQKTGHVLQSELGWAVATELHSPRHNDLKSAVKSCAGVQHGIPFRLKEKLMQVLVVLHVPPHCF